MTALLILSLGLVLVLGGKELSAQDAPGSTFAPVAHPKVVCYMAGWAHWRPDAGKFQPENVDVSLCSHVVFAFAFLDVTGTNITMADPSFDGPLYLRLAALKQHKPSLRVLLGVGGWGHSRPFALTTATKQNMNAFASNAVEFLHRFGFDGLDIDWEYPTDWNQHPEEKAQFTQFLHVVKHQFYHDRNTTGRPRLSLSAMISGVPDLAENAYDLPDISKYLDFLNVLTYDVHGAWDQTVGHHSTLYSPTDDEKDSIDYEMSHLLAKGVPRTKLLMGLAFYGRSFNLADPSSSGIGAAHTGPGAAGALTREKGVLAYYEVCKLLTEHNDTVTSSGRLEGTSAPYVVDGSRWTGYDDAQSIKEKVRYVQEHGLGGVFIWTIDMDDFHGSCGAGQFPLLSAVKQQIHGTGLVGR